MRAMILLVPMLAAAAPVSAQMARPSAEMPVIPPGAADRAASTLDAITDALLDLRIGKLKAAIDGRPASPAERQMTIRELEARKDPGFERRLHRQIAEARPVIRQGIEQVNDTVPDVMDSIDRIGRAFDRAMANMPDPTYPVR